VTDSDSASVPPSVKTTPSSSSAERIEIGEGPRTPQRVVASYTCRGMSLLFRISLLAAGVFFGLVVVVALPMLLTDAYVQISWPLAYGALFAFLSQLSSLGKGIQKIGVQSLPEMSFRRDVLLKYAKSPTWRIGFLMDISGAVFGLAALTILPISIAQPIFCNGLVLLALYSHLYLDEQLGAREWISIGLCFAGTVLLAVTLVPRDWTHTNLRWIQVKLGLAVCVALPLLAAAEIGGRLAKRGRVWTDERGQYSAVGRFSGHSTPSPDRAAVELFAGLQAGMCIGVGLRQHREGRVHDTSETCPRHVPQVGNACIATGLQSTSPSWRRQVSGVNIMWHLFLSGAFVVCGILLNGSHPIFANRGYQHGRVVLISTYTSLTSMATGVFIGTVVLDESWPAQPRMSMLRQMAFLLIFWGVLTLNGQRAAAAIQRGAGAAFGMAGGAGGERPPPTPTHKRHLSDPPLQGIDLHKLRNTASPQR